MYKIDQRTRQVLIKMIEKPIIPQRNLTGQLNLSRVQVDYVITKINESLSDEGLPPVYFDGNNYHLSEASRLFFVDFFSSDHVYRYYEMDIEERKKYIYLMLFYHYEEYLSVNHFLGVLDIGKTTFINDLKKVEKELESLDIQIKYNRKKGYYLAGNESVLRYQLMKMVLEDLRSDNGSFLWDYFLFNEGTIQKEKVFRQIAAELEHYSIVLVENRLLEFSYMLIFLLPHLSKEWSEFYERYNFQKFYQMKEYSFSRSLLAKFSIDNPYAILYICGWMLGMAIGDADEEAPDSSIINELVERIFDRFERLSGIRFKDKKTVKKQVYSHFRPAYYRLFFHLPIINPLSKKIIQEYPDLFQIVKETMKPIENLFGTMIPDEEISFLTIHFASLIDNNDEYQVKRKVGIIVCPNGISISLLLKNTLQNLLPEIDFVELISERKFYRNNYDVDFIFSAIPLETEKPVFVVNNFLTDQEKRQLRERVLRSVTLAQNTVINPEKIMSLIKKYAVISDEENLYHELLTLFTPKDFERLEKKRIHLIDTLKMDTIQIFDDAIEWSELLDKLARPLEKQKVISKNFVTVLKQEMPILPQYTVLRNTIGLPHTMSEAGALGVGISMGIVKKGILTENGSKVHTVVLLASNDKDKHVDLIFELMSLAGSEQLKKIEEATSIREIRTLLVDFSEKYWRN